MIIDNLIAALVLAVILGGAVWYLIRAKKKGVKCIGCPDGAKCAGSCSGCAGNCSGCGKDQQ